jgi:hypothetical protein
MIRPGSTTEDCALSIEAINPYRGDINTEACSNKSDGEAQHVAHEYGLQWNQRLDFGTIQGFEFQYHGGDGAIAQRLPGGLVA